MKRFRSFSGISFLFAILISCIQPSLPLDEEIEYAGPPVFKQSGGDTYYIDSSGGSDSNDGLSPSSPFASLAPVNNNDISAGTTILLKRGEWFAGPLFPGKGAADNYIKYGAYGSGVKPVLFGADELLSGGTWNASEPDIREWSEPFSKDIGQIYFNNGTFSGSKKWSLADLNSEGDFYYERNSGKLYLYSDSDPSVVYSSILAARTEHIVNFSGSSYILFENLDLRYGAAHGFGGGNTDHLIIQDCDFSYIGGGWLAGAGDQVRYGNGIEFWGNASNHLVQRNTFREIYDTAVTNQNHSTVVSQHNIFYINNMMSNCGLASFEVWNRPALSRTAHIYFIHNTSYNPGFGWGNARDDHNHFHIALFYHEAATNDIVIGGNIFYSSATPAGALYNLLFLDENPSGNFDEITFQSNLWYVPGTQAFAVKSTIYENLAAFVNATGKGGQGLWAEAQFTDAGAGDFSLTSGSPGRNLVPDLGIRTADFFGNSVSFPATGGAVE